MNPVLLSADYMTNKEYLDIANMPIMWLMVIPTVIVVCIQAFLFIKTAVKTAPVLDLKKSDIKSAMRAGAICSIGPGLSMFTVMIALMSILGGPFAWLRLSIIGTMTTEMIGANAGAAAMGVELSGADYGIIAFACSVWVITLNTCGFFVVNLFFTHKMEKIKTILEKKDAQLFGVIGLAILLGSLTMFLTMQMVTGRGELVAVIAGFISMLVFMKIAEKFPKIKEFNLGFAMLVGIFIAQFAVQLGG